MIPSFDKGCCLLRKVLFLSAKAAIFPVLLEIATVGCNPTVAQITPDNTLGNERTVVNSGATIQGAPGVLIEGGATRGVNLFQSFSEFNVGNGQRVYFANPSGIENILSRVTGGNVSNILGTLGVNGGANLFLLNPNGIVFGPNASLDVSGSFFASTAERLEFNNGSFSATNGQVPGLLTLDFTPGLQLGRNLRGDINSSANLQVGEGQTLSLEGSNLNLSGSLRTLGGTVKAFGDRDISTNELNIDTSANNGGNITLNAGGRVSIVGGTIVSGSNNNRESFGEISINGRTIFLDRTAISTTNLGTGLAGDVKINGQERVEIFNSSGIFSRGRVGRLFIDANQGSVFLNNTRVNTNNEGEGVSGDIFIDARDQISITDSNISSDGSFGRIFIGISNESQIPRVSEKEQDFNNLSLPTNININNSILTTDANIERERGGRISIYSNEQINIVNDKEITNPEKEIASRINNTDNSSNNFSVVELFSRNGSVILDNAKISTTNFNTGFAGDVAITAREQVQINNNSRIFSRGEKGRVLIGQSAYAPFSPRIFSMSNSKLNTDNDALQTDNFIQAGGVSVITNDSISLSNAQIFSSSSQLGNAGIVFIKTPGNVTLNDNSKIFSNAERGTIGDGGNILIDAGSLLLFGGSQVQTLVRGESEVNEKLPAQGNAGNIVINVSNEMVASGRNQQNNSSGIFSIVDRDAQGKSGNILIGGRLLHLARGGLLTVRNSGQGEAGNIVIQTPFVVLDREALIQGTSASGTGGNIVLQVANLVALSRGSNITTSSTSGQFSENGGNITINRNDADGRTIFVFGFPLKDNDISAEANAGAGGRINISSVSIRDLIVSNDPSPNTNDISTRSRQNVNGITNVNTLNIDPERGIVPLPDRFTDRRISEGCDPRVRQGTSTFLYVGRTGLAPTAEISLPETLATNITAPQGDTNPLSQSVENSPSTANTEPQQKVPAQGWIVDKNGDIILTAYPTNSDPTNNYYPSMFVSPTCHVQ
jgi:filamentous hemagglutinin family protein